MVQRAADGPRADIRLQNILLHAALDTLPSEADDDRLRIHRALATNYATLGAYREALTHGQHELDLRTHIQGPHHPNTLTTRRHVARWTGESGDPATALRLLQDLLPDLEQVHGPRHPDTLVTRGNIARWTGECGDRAAALRLYQDLLPDLEQVLGPVTPTPSVRRRLRDGGRSWPGWRLPMRGTADPSPPDVLPRLGCFPSPRPEWSEPR
jgi:hypothetical protein